jgi:uncharacterized membrane protein
VIGLLLLIPTGGADRAIVDQLRSSTVVGNAPPPLGVLVADAFRGQPTAVILFGILLLVMTPVIRVVTAVIYFWRHHDRPFAVIGSIVLALLIVGFIMGRFSAARAAARGARDVPALRLTL